MLIFLILMNLYVYSHASTSHMPSQVHNVAWHSNPEICKGMVGSDADLDRDPFLVPCHSLDNRWIVCSRVTELTTGKSVNGTAELINVCPYFGGAANGPLLMVNVTCMAMPCIECKGERMFLREFECAKYTGHYFLTALLYSVFLGFLAVDRFYLGYSAMAIAKLMTLGGFGLWWIVDILLLLGGYLLPADDSSWQPWELWDEQ